ncbi:hypothetical protein EV359DRAFT_80838 [Lentinula novae-zelandiae]|nr:hypothetical protein EV359DRAFT_80838 [Lentinula novae-zelandiae]
MRFNIIHLSLGLVSVVYAAPVMHTVSVTTAPVRNEATTPHWDPFEGPPIKLEYKYVPPAGEKPQKDHEDQKDNKYARYADDVVNRILEHQGERKMDVPFTWDPRKFAFEILTPIRVFDVEHLHRPNQATGEVHPMLTVSTGLRRFPMVSTPQAPTSRTASPAPASPHSPDSPYFPGSPASDASDDHQHVHAGGHSVNHVGNVTMSGNASFRVGNTYHY